MYLSNKWVFYLEAKQLLHLIYFHGHRLIAQPGLVHSGLAILVKHTLQDQLLILLSGLLMWRIGTSTWWRHQSSLVDGSRKRSLWDVPLSLVGIFILALLLFLELLITKFLQAFLRLLCNLLFFHDPFKRNPPLHGYLGWSFLCRLILGQTLNDWLWIASLSFPGVDSTLACCFMRVFLLLERRS